MEIRTYQELQAAIVLLEVRKRAQQKDLADHWKTTYESFRPMNILKSTFQDAAGSSEFKGNLLNAALGVGAGLLSKKLFFGGSGSVIKKLLGTAVEFGVAKTVAQKSGNVVGKGLLFLKNVLGKKRLSASTNGRPR